MTDDDVEAYAQRNQTLKELGFNSYSDYLESREWREITNKARFKNGRCYGCGHHSEEIHHLSYSKEVLLGNDMEKLVAVCHGCHKQAEFECDLPLSEMARYYEMSARYDLSDIGAPDLFRTKMTLAQANERLKTIRRCNIKNKTYNFERIPTDDEIIERFRKKAHQYKSEGKSIRGLMEQLSKDLGKYPYYRGGDLRCSEEFYLEHYGGKIRTS